MRSLSLLLLLAAPHAAADPLNPLTLEPCDAGSANQSWSLSAAGALHLPAAGGGKKARCLNGARVDQESIPFVDACDPVAPDASHVWQHSRTNELRYNDSAKGWLCLAAASVAHPHNPALLRPCAAPAGLATRWSRPGSGAGPLRPANNASLCLTSGAPVPSASCASAALSALPFCNASLPPSVRARDLVSRMSTFELKRNSVSNPSGIPRLGVPRFGMGEALHGVVTNCGEPFEGNSECTPNPRRALLL